MRASIYNSFAHNLTQEKTAHKTSDPTDMKIRRPNIQDPPAIHGVEVVDAQWAVKGVLKEARTRFVENRFSSEERRVKISKSEGRSDKGRRKKKSQTETRDLLSSKRDAFDAFDRACNAFEQFTGLDDGATLKSVQSTARSIKSKEDARPKAIQLYEQLEREKAIGQDKDVIDRCFEKVEYFMCNKAVNCGDDTQKNPKQASPRPLIEEQDAIDRFFERIEEVACRPVERNLAEPAAIHRYEEITREDRAFASDIEEKDQEQQGLVSQVNEKKDQATSCGPDHDISTKAGWFPKEKAVMDALLPYEKDTFDIYMEKMVDASCSPEELVKTACGNEEKETMQPLPLRIGAEPEELVEAACDNKEKETMQPFPRAEGSFQSTYQKDSLDTAFESLEWFMCEQE